MNDGRLKFPRAVAIEAARELAALLGPACESGMPAPFELRPMSTDLLPWLRTVGSVRRGRAEVKDLELLVLSRTERVPAPESLFGDTIEGCAAHRVLDELVARGVLAKRLNAKGSTMWGDDNRYAIHVASGLPVDFFFARRANWANLLVCKTGGRVHNEMICNAAIARGLKWSPPSAGFLNRTTGQLARTVRCEEDVFTITGLPWLPPHLRP